MGKRRRCQPPKHEDPADKVIVKLEPAAVDSYKLENNVAAPREAGLSEQESSQMPQIEGMEVEVRVIQPVDSLSDSGEDLPAPTPSVCSGREQIIVENYEHPYYKHSTRSRSARKPVVTTKNQLTKRKSGKNQGLAGSMSVENANMPSTKARKKRSKAKSRNNVIKNYRCPYCFDISKRATFVIGSMEKRILEKHLRVEHNVKSTKGCVACDAVFRTFQDLNIHHYKAHRLVSEDIQEFKCTECRYKTCYSWNFKRHLLGHEQKLISCTICDMEFASEEQVNNHIENTHRKRKSEKLHSSGYHKHSVYTGYKCELCYQTLESLSALEEHIDAAHLGNVI